VTALFEFSGAFVDAVTPDVVAMAQDARDAIAQAIDSRLPEGVTGYWEGDEYVIPLTAEQTASEFGAADQPPRALVRQSLMMSVPEAQRAGNAVVAERDV
jgi:hypothetical protein